MRRLLLSLALVTGLAAACTPLEPSSEPPSEADAPITTPTPSAEAAELDEPDTAPRSAGPITVTVIPEHAVLAGKPGTLNLMIRLEGQGDAGPRPPVDLALVLDRSGSMGGEKMLAVKQAAIELVDQLEPSDHVSLVTYASDITVHGRRRALNPLGKAFFRQELLGLEPTGGTALGPALFDGLARLHEAQRDKDELAHVLLLSDGMANEGETDPEIIASRARQAFAFGISTSTLGVGLDYNEDLMTQIADAGGGRYHFIESSTVVAQVLSDELAGLASTVARGIELELRPTTGVEVDQVFGYENSRDGAKVGALVGSLAAHQTRAILVRVQYPAPQVPGLAIGELVVRYVDAETGAPGQLSLRPKVAVVTSPAAVAKSENLEVTVRAAELDASQKLSEAAAAVEARNYDEAKESLNSAIHELREQNAETPAPALQQQIIEYERALDDVDEAAIDETARKRANKKFKTESYKSGKK